MTTLDRWYAAGMPATEESLCCELCGWTVGSASARNVVGALRRLALDPADGLFCPDCFTEYLAAGWLVPTVQDASCTS